MSRQIITITTDFGDTHSYLAQMKGVILSINPEATIIDLTHRIPPQDVVHVAQSLPELVRYFPADTIHIVVVDPGVGSDRKIVYTRFGSQQFVSPDNVCLTGLAHRE